MIDENLLFVALITIFAVFIIQKQPYLIGIIGLITVFYYLYKGRFTNPKDFFSFITNKFKESFEPCGSGNLAYCGTNDVTNNNMSFLPNAIRSSEPNDKPLKIEDYQIDKRLDFGETPISINEIIKEIPIILDYKIYIDKVLKFTLSIYTDDNIQKDFLARKICNKMTKIVYNAYNTLTNKDYPINNYTELLYAEREFNDTLNIFVFLGMNDSDTNTLADLQKEFKQLNDKLNEFIIEKVNDITPNDYDITTSFLPQLNEPVGVSSFDNYINL
jgi:hypothetical protein